MAKNKKTVGLFVTCLVDLFRPSVGFAAVKLLENTGCDVHVPLAQTCCGQPAYNSGDKKDTADIARQVIRTFEKFDYVVAPSGSCAGMIKKHYVSVFDNEPEWHERAKKLSDKTYELVSFLVEVMKVRKIPGEMKASITYHDSCSGLRELGIHDQPRKLLKSLKGIKLVEMENAQDCCGFGGTFAVKYDEVSNAIVSEKTRNIADANAQILAAGDLGCLMNMAGKLKRQKNPIEVRHIAEILADMCDKPPIGGS